MKRFWKRLPLVLLFLSIATTVVVSAHYYIARRLVLDPGLAEPWRSLGLGVVIAGFAFIALQPFGERLLRPGLARLVVWPASLWMGLMFLLLVLLGATDVLLWLGGSAALAAANGASEAPSAAVARAAGVLMVAFLAGAYGMRSALRPPRTVRVEIPLARWPKALDGFRIVQISDVHIGPILDGRFAAHVVERVNALEPDLVAVTGDLVDGSASKLAGEVAPFGGLRGRHGVFFVTGNHDHYSGVRSWVDVVTELGMRPLRNERVEIERDGASFDLVGVDDHRGSVVLEDGGEDLDRAFAGRDPARPAVLLAHDPSTFKRSSRLGIDLQISGHTHGGQIWPFAYVVRLAIPFVAGLYQRNGARLYVSRGTGFWGPPMRLFAPAEITEIVLRAGDELPESPRPNSTGPDAPQEDRR